MKRKQLDYGSSCTEEAAGRAPGFFEKSRLGLSGLRDFNTDLLITVAERLRHDRQSPNY
jgi:hypothetical protein